MADPGFGVDEESFKDSIAFVTQVLRQSKKTSDYLDAKAILYQAYETGYGIHDYLDQARQETVALPERKRPLSSVAMHFAEDFTSTSEYRRMARLFVDKNVGGVFHMSWEEFLDLTPDKCEDLLLIAAEHGQRSNKDAAKTLASLEAAAGDLRGNPARP